MKVFNEIETVNDALVAAVVSAGGFKCVGARLWPEMNVGAAHRKLLDCLNPDRPHHLSPEQAMLLLKWARDAPDYAPWQAWCELAGFGFAPPKPAMDEQAQHRLQMQSLMAQVQSLMARIDGAAR